MILNGSEIIVECLKEQGVDTVFGYPGGAILNVYDALYKHSDEITHILTSHEQGASHAADGYARATGKVGVCFATSGPGATNLVTGIATAMMDSIPMVAITCNVTLPLLGRDSFQEVDIAGIVMPITKHSFIVKDVNELADTLRRAFRIAKEGRPGPVLVDITKDATANECDYIKETPKPIERITDTISEEAVENAAAMIKAAKKPYVFVGGGVIASDASEELKKFVRKIDAPVCDTLMGKGAFDGSDPHYTGMLGMHGTKTSNFGVSECDLLITIGARFSDRVTGNTKKFAKNAKILQFDVDAAEINKNIHTDASVIGDALEILKRVNAKLEQLDHADWLAHLKEYEEKFPMKYRTDVLNGPYIMEKIYEIMGLEEKVHIEQVLPADIEHRSFEIIGEELKAMGKELEPEQAPVIMRAIHTTADFDYADHLKFSENAVEKAREAIKKGAVIITDTKMGWSGVNKKRLESYGGEALCFMADEDVAAEAKKNGSTRAVASMDKAANLFGDGTRPCIFAIGNAPTALIRLYELIQERKIKPALIIGAPVGFVNVIQSKELILSLKDTPYIVAEGRKGGSNVAAAICNALLYGIK